MCCEGEVPELSTAVTRMVAQARRRLSRTEDLGADAWASPMAGRPQHYSGTDPFGSRWYLLEDRRGPTAEEIARAFVDSGGDALTPGLVRLSIRDEAAAWDVPEPRVAAEGQGVDVPVLVTVSRSPRAGRSSAPHPGDAPPREGRPPAPCPSFSAVVMRFEHTYDVFRQGAVIIPSQR